MHIIAQGQSIEAIATSDNTKVKSSEMVKKPNVSNKVASQPVAEKSIIASDEQDIPKEKLEQAIDTVNEFFTISRYSNGRSR